MVRPLIERNFDMWSGIVARWLSEPSAALPPDVDRRRLARFVLAVMEGAVMQARGCGSLGPFDLAVGELRRHFDLLRTTAGGRAARPTRRDDRPRRGARR